MHTLIFLKKTNIYVEMYISNVTNFAYVRQDSSQVSKTLTVNVETIYWNSIGIFM